MADNTDSTPERSATPRPASRVPAQVVAGHVINSVMIGLLVAGAGGLVLPRFLRANGLSLRGGEVAYMLVCLFVLAALVAFLVFSAISQFNAEKNAKDRAAEALARKQKTARRPKDWGDLLEDRLQAYDALFPAPPPQEGQPPAEPAVEAPPELKTTERVPVPFEDGAVPPPTRTAPPLILPTPSPPPAGAMAATPASPQQPPSPDPALISFAERAYEMVTVDSLEFSDRERFGLHLFIAGACGELTQRRAWTAAEGQAALSGALTQIGMARDFADGFAASANAFAQIDALRPMIDGGAAAMKIWLDRKERADQGAEAFYAMSMLFTGWGSSAESIVAPDRVFVLAVAVDVAPLGAEGISPETHRAILRGTKTLIEGAVSSGGGSEVCHVHTGLAAAFAYGEAAIRAAIEIQESADAWARSWDKYRITLQVAVDTAFAALVGETFVSEGLLRTVRLLLATPPEQIICTEPVRHEALDGDQFLPQVLADAPQDTPALFQVPWTREQPAVDHKPVEYRQIGGNGSEIVSAAQKAAALEEWLKQAGVSSASDQSRTD